MFLGVGNQAGVLQKVRKLHAITRERKSFMHVEVPASHGTEICAIIIKAFRPPLDTVVVWIHTFFGPSLSIGSLNSQSCLGGKKVDS